ncbi:MAG: PorP/SprF family type IX secretion system membrane protein [Bacteroidales bacterium]
MHKTTLHIVLIVICVLLFQKYTPAQDIHFSNFYTNALHLNPALTGFFKGKYRLGVAFRDQYRTVAVPYQTMTFTCDGKLSPARFGRQNMGLGLMLTYDIAGDSHFSTMQIGIPFAYHIKTYAKNWKFSGGILPSVYTNAIDYTQLKFPDQFDGIQYTPDIPTQENIIDKNLAYFNIGAGLFGMYTPNKKVRYGVGLAIYNITQPNISFYSDNNIILPRRYLIHGLSHIELRRDWDVIPAAKVQFQTTQHEYQFGATVLHYTHSTRIPKINAGIWFRARDKDAVILGIGGLVNGYNIILNYDINMSTLKTASNGHGALELSISYILTSLRRGNKKAPVKCPAYL